MSGRGGGWGSLAVLAILVAILLFGARREDSGGPAGTGPQGPAGAGSPPAGAVRRARVLRVVDGDTIEVALDGRTEDVRYIGVDTPETVKPDTPVQCYGPQASERNHQLVEGQTVQLEFDRELRDVYGRLLAYVYADGRFVNAELVAGGFARTLEIEPNTSRAAELGRLEDEAGAAGLGLWGAC